MVPSYQRPFFRAAHGGHHAHAPHVPRTLHPGHLFQGKEHVHFGMRLGEVDGAVHAEVQAAIKPLTGFGWEWRQDGVILTLTIDGSPVRVFVPLQWVWEELHNHMHAMGCPMQAPAVGEPLSVGSIFGSISHAVSSVAHAASSAVKAVVPKAVQKAATAVVSKAASVGKAAIESKILRYGLDAAAVAVPALAPAAIALETAHQALEHVNEGIKAAQAIKNGVVSAANVAKATLGLNTQHATAIVVQKAQAGDKAAQQMVGAFKQLALTRAAAVAPGTPHGFLATVARNLPGVAQTHGAGLFQVAAAAAAAKQHVLKAYRVHQRAA